MGLDARAPALRLVPLQTCDTVLAPARLPVARAGCAAGRTARHTSARRLDFIAPDPVCPSKEPAHDFFLLQRLGIALPIIRAP